MDEPTVESEPTSDARRGNPLAYQFDDWLNLAQQDPQRFKQLRAQAITELIATAPRAERRRLRGLQWTIDRERERCPNSTAAANRISDMMWYSLAGAGGLLEALTSLGEPRMSTSSNNAGAEVIAFDGQQHAAPELESNS